MKFVWRTMPFKLRWYQIPAPNAWNRCLCPPAIWCWSVQTSASGWDRHCSEGQSAHFVSPDGGDDSWRNADRRAWKQIWFTDCHSLPRFFNHSVSMSLCRLLALKWFAPIHLINHKNTNPLHRETENIMQHFEHLNVDVRECVSFWGVH